MWVSRGGRSSKAVPRVASPHSKTLARASGVPRAAPGGGPWRTGPPPNSHFRHRRRPAISEAAPPNPARAFFIPPRNLAARRSSGQPGGLLEISPAYHAGSAVLYVTAPEVAGDTTRVPLTQGRGEWVAIVAHSGGESRHWRFLVCQSYAVTEGQTPKTQAHFITLAIPNCSNLTTRHRPHPIYAVTEGHGPPFGPTGRQSIAQGSGELAAALGLGFYGWRPERAREVPKLG